MAFADPINVRVDGTTDETLDRISTSENKSVYSNADGSVKATISHTYGKRTRRVLRLDLVKVGPDPMFPDQNTTYTFSTYTVLDQPKVGFTQNELADAVEGLAAFVAASINAERWVTGQN